MLNSACQTSPAPPAPYLKSFTHEEIPVKLDSLSLLQDTYIVLTSRYLSSKANTKSKYTEIKGLVKWAEDRREGELDEKGSGFRVTWRIEMEEP